MELNRSQGIISSPGFGFGNYPDKLDCTWKINEPQNRTIDMIFHYFDTEKFFDTVDVLDDVPKSLIKRFSGKLATLPSQAFGLLTGSSVLRVTFKSDYSYNKKGFNATFSIGKS